MEKEIVPNEINTRRTVLGVGDQRTPNHEPFDIVDLWRALESASPILYIYVVAVPLRIALAVVYIVIVTKLIYLGCRPFEHPKPDLAVVMRR